MIKLENDCVGGCGDTGFGCRGSLCPLRSVPHFYCDNCGEEIDANDEDEIKMGYWKYIGGEDEYKHVEHEKHFCDFCYDKLNEWKDEEE